MLRARLASARYALGAHYERTSSAAPSFLPLASLRTRSMRRSTCAATGHTSCGAVCEFDIRVACGWNGAGCANDRVEFGVRWHLCEICEDELERNHLDVTQRVNRTGHMHNVVIHKAAHNVYYCVALTDVGQELVPEALALGGTCHQTSDVHKG